MSDVMTLAFVVAFCWMGWIAGQQRRVARERDKETPIEMDTAAGERITVQWTPDGIWIKRDRPWSPPEMAHDYLGGLKVIADTRAEEGR